MKPPYHQPLPGPQRSGVLLPPSYLRGWLAGITGWACAHLLHVMEHLVWSFSEGHLLTALYTIPWWRRILTLGAAGLIGGVSWWLLHRTGPGPVPMRQAVAGERMPVLRTIWHAATQIIVIAMGASLGREWRHGRPVPQCPDGSATD